MQIEITEIRQKLSKIFPWIVILVLIALLFQKCESNEVLANALKTEKATTKYYTNELGTTTASNEVLQLEKRELKEIIKRNDSLSKLSSEFSEVKTIIKYRTITKFDSILIPFETKIPCDFERLGELNNEWYSLGYKATQDGITIEPFETWTDVTTITGFKKKWFWGRKTYTTDITASNPNITIENVQSLEEKVPVKWYETTLLKVGIGVIGGYLITK